MGEEQCRIFKEYREVMGKILSGMEESHMQKWVCFLHVSYFLLFRALRFLPSSEQEILVFCPKFVRKDRNLFCAMSFLEAREERRKEAEYMKFLQVMDLAAELELCGYPADAYKWGFLQFGEKFKIWILKHLYFSTDLLKHLLFFEFSEHNNNLCYIFF